MMNFYGNNYPQQGMVPNPAQNLPKTGNWLNAEKYALLQKGLNQFKLSVTEQDLAIGQCNHYYPNGQVALLPDSDGSGGSTCAICGTHFHSHDYTQEEVKAITQNLLDVLNTIKIMYLSIDPSAALEFFQIIPFIQKTPELYNIAVNDFKKYEGVGTFVPSQMANPFNIFNMMTNPGLAPMQPAPMYNGQPAPAPMAPMGYPQQQAAPGFNPLYGQQMPMGYQPQTQGFAMNPVGAAAPMYNTNMPNAQNPTAQPAAPAAAPAEEQVSVDTQFKK